MPIPLLLLMTFRLLKIIPGLLYTNLNSVLNICLFINGLIIIRPFFYAFLQFFKNENVFDIGKSPASFFSNYHHPEIYKKAAALFVLTENSGDVRIINDHNYRLNASCYEKCYIN